MGSVRPGRPVAGLYPLCARRESGSVCVNQQTAEYARSLDEPSRLLLAVRDELYGGDWELLVQDLGDRLAGRPYIFRLASRIQDDLDRIRRMREFETSRHVDLREYVHQD